MSRLLNFHHLTAPSGAGGGGGGVSNEYFLLDASDSVTWSDGDKYVQTLKTAGHAVVAPWATEAQETEYLNDNTYIASGIQSAFELDMHTAGHWCGWYWTPSGMIYMPGQNAAGNIANTNDFAAMFDAVRFVYWIYWTNSASSDQFNSVIGETPTAGTANHGGVNCAIDRNSNSKWRWSIADGNGNAINQYLSPDPGAMNNQTSYIYGEFVAGSHAKMRLLKWNGGRSFSGWSAGDETWSAIDTGYYSSVDLSGGRYAQLTPICPMVSDASSAENVNAYICRAEWELRPIGGSWLTLKD